MMSVFQFPDPSITSTAVNPTTGELWRFSNNAWALDSTIKSDDTSSANTEMLALIAEIRLLRIEVETLKTDIINLRADINSAQTNDFLILD